MKPLTPKQKIDLQKYQGHFQPLIILTLLILLLTGLAWAHTPSMGTLLTTIPAPYKGQTTNQSNPLKKPFKKYKIQLQIHPHRPPIQKNTHKKQP